MIASFFSEKLQLFDRLDEQPDYHYTEAQCARLVKQMLCSVRYIHSKGIIHRDLKLENFLFSNTSARPLISPSLSCSGPLMPRRGNISIS